MGGSLGADAINNALVEMLTSLKDDKNICFLHATGSFGKWVGDKLRENGVEFGQGTNIEIREYIDNMDICLPACDLVISRAGASSLSEIQALAKPSILVPSPNVAENHQYHNAMTLKRIGAAEIIEEKDLSDDNLIHVVSNLIENKPRLNEMSAAATKGAIIDANERIYEIIMQLYTNA